MPEDPEKRGEEPNLELPSLFGRGRKKKRQAEEPAPETTEEIDPAATDTDTDTDTSTPVEDAAPPGPVPVEGSSRRLPPTPPPPARNVEETAPIRAGAPIVEPPVVEPPGVEPPGVEPPVVEPPVVDPPVEPVPPPVPVEPTPEPEPTPQPEPSPAPPPTPDPVPEPVPEPEPIPEPSPEPAPAPVKQTAVLPAVTPGPPAQGDEQDLSAPPLFADEAPVPPPSKAPRERKPVSLPRINPRVAALVTGLVVGLVGVLLAFGASQSCAAVRGVGSCGGVGLFALLGVLIIEIVLGSILLKAWGLLDPTSTSFLGVGLVAVMALLFFLSSLDSVWMLLVIPLLTGLTFMLSWWVTETFIEQNSDDLHR